MAVAVFVLIIGLLQVVSQINGENQTSDEDCDTMQDFYMKADTIVQFAQTEVVMLTNQVMVNASLITHAAEGNASRLLADLYNEINEAVADAQVKVAKIGSWFQTDFTGRVNGIVSRADHITTKVEKSIRNATDQMELSIRRLLNTTEAQIANTVLDIRHKMEAKINASKAAADPGQ